VRARLVVKEESVLELVAGGLDEVEDASCEFDPRVEIVS